MFLRSTSVAVLVLTLLAAGCAGIGFSGETRSVSSAVVSLVALRTLDTDTPGDAPLPIVPDDWIASELSVEPNGYRVTLQRPMGTGYEGELVCFSTVDDSSASGCGSGLVMERMDDNWFWVSTRRETTLEVQRGNPQELRPLLEQAIIRTSEIFASGDRSQLGLRMDLDESTALLIDAIGPGTQDFECLLTAIEEPNLPNEVATGVAELTRSDIDAIYSAVDDCA